MTQDYKDILSNYITGDLEIGEMSNNQFRDNEMITNNLKQKLQEKGITPNATIQTLTTDTTSNYLMYGSYNQGGKSYGWIAILDQSGNILEILTTYDTGTKMGTFYILNYDETGNIYGMDYYSQTNKERFIMLNNVAVSTTTGYKCRLRQSYNIPTSPEYYGSPMDFISGTSYIKKVPGEATYFMFGSNDENKVMLVKLVINVGSPNEWTYYKGSSLGTGAIQYCDFILSGTGDDITAHIYYKLTNNQYVLFHDYFNGSNLSRQGDFEFASNIVDFRMLTNTNVYVASRTSLGNNKYNIILFDYKGVSADIITQYQITSTQIPIYYIELINGLLFTKVSGKTSNTQFDTICGVYDREEFIKSPTYTMNISDYINTGCTVQQMYSLYRFAVQGANVVYRPSIVVYDNQYDGGSYIDYTSLIPLHSEIYSNGYIAFARGLYNKQVYQNMCVATVNIPNNYLNDIPLQPSKLLGQTMVDLVLNENIIQKNIYENLFINFNNKIQVIDEDTNTLYPETANWLNLGVNYASKQGYEQSELNKIRINYEDDTSSIQEIQWENVNGIKETKFSLYVSKLITSIDFINENEDFTYITKEYEMEVGKTYTITQKLRID